jgi:hypothetical protein
MVSKNLSLILAPLLAACAMKASTTPSPSTSPSTSPEPAGQMTVAEQIARGPKYEVPIPEVATPSPPCDGAHDHCLGYDNVWFVNNGDPEGPLAVCFRAEDGYFYTWWDGHYCEGTTAMRTRVARPDEIHVGDTVFAFQQRQGTPPTAAAARKSWAVVKVGDKDLEPDRLRVRGLWISRDGVRVATESVPNPQPPK